MALPQAKMQPPILSTAGAVAVRNEKGMYNASCYLLMPVGDMKTQLHMYHKLSFYMLM